MARTSSLLLILSLCLPVWAQLRLPAFFADGMVLQRDVDIPVWGWGVPDSPVTVFLSGQQTTVQSDSQGQWRLTLPPLRAGGPHVMTVAQGRDTLRLRNILMGDLYLCSGQSNMELPIRRCWDVESIRQVASTTINDQVRYLKIPHQYDYTAPHQDMRTMGWESISPRSAQEMGALCYFLGLELQQHQQVPIGIINSSVGGTQVDAWTSRNFLLMQPGYTERLQDTRYTDPTWPRQTMRAEGEAQHQWDLRLQAQDHGMPANPQQWSLQDIFQDFSGQTPNGSFWFVQHVRLTADQLTSGTALLRLGAMKDADSVWVNGHLVGTTSYEYPPRKYEFPVAFLREGDNEVRIHLFSYSDRPNFTEGKLYQLELGSTIIPLPRQWHFHRGSTLPERPASTYFVNNPVGLYNAMIAPLRDLPFRAVVWYQGESDCGPDAGHYAQRLQHMMQCWRQQFGRPVPLVIVQIAGFQQQHPQPVESDQAIVRNQQRLASRLIPQSALSSALDLGEWNDIHPQRKDALASRVVLNLRRLVYGEELVSEGPVPVSGACQGREITIDFDPATGTLQGDGPLASFAVSDASGHWHWVPARVVAPHRIQLSVPQSVTLGQHPSVRYAWDDFPRVTLYNKEGLPASGFELEIQLK